MRFAFLKFLCCWLYEFPEGLFFSFFIYLFFFIFYIQFLFIIFLIHFLFIIYFFIFYKIFYLFFFFFLFYFLGVRQFLSGNYLPTLVEIVSTHSNNHLSGLSALLIGICFHYDENEETKKSTKAIITHRIGTDKFFGKLIIMRKRFSFYFFLYFIFCFIFLIICFLFFVLFYLLFLFLIFIYFFQIVYNLLLQNWTVLFILFPTISKKKKKSTKQQNSTSFIMILILLVILKLFSKTLKDNCNHQCTIFQQGNQNFWNNFILY